MSAWVPRDGDYKDRTGFIMYDGKGGMGVHHVPGYYNSYSTRGTRDSLHRSDLLHLSKNFVYFGKYRVDHSNRTIEHHIESSHSVARLETIAKRTFEFKGDTLILSPVTDRYPKSRLKWLKLNDLKP